MVQSLPIGLQEPVLWNCDFHNSIVSAKAGFYGKNLRRFPRAANEQGRSKQWNSVEGRGEYNFVAQRIWHIHQDQNCMFGKSQRCNLNLITAVVWSFSVEITCPTLLLTRPHFQAFKYSWSCSSQVGASLPTLQYHFFLIHAAPLLVVEHPFEIVVQRKNNVNEKELINLSKIRCPYDGDILLKKILRRTARWCA